MTSTHFSALPWEDIDALYTAFVGDLLMAASHLEATDVLVYRDAEELSDDYFLPFRHMIRLLDAHERPFPEQIERAIDGAFRENYLRVLVLLDNNPTLKPESIRRLFDQLTYEDDCLVISPTLEGRCSIVGMKSNHARLFESSQEDPIAGPHVLLRRACATEAEIFVTRPGRSLDSATSLAALRDDILERDPSSAGFPSRTFEVFRMLDKKYGGRKAAR